MTYTKVYEQERDDGMSSVIHYFINSNGSRGPVSYYNSNFCTLNRTFLLEGYPRKAVEQSLQSILARAASEGMPAEVIHSPLDNSMQGVILPRQSAGIFTRDPWDVSSFSGLALLYPVPIEKVRNQIAEASRIFFQARKIHDEWEKIYIENMDFNAANQLAQETILRVIGDHSLKKKGSEVHRFFGAATASGNLDYIDNITAEISKRYFIKGRPGTGKSTFLKKIAAAATAKGFRAEIYHCSFDPDSLDLVALRELGVCLFDSTAPHEYFPSRENDEIIHIYEIAVRAGTDESHANALSKIKSAYKERVTAAASLLAGAKKSADDLDRTLPPINSAALQAETHRLISQLFEETNG